MSYIDAIKKDETSYDIHDSRIGEEDHIVKKYVISAPLTLETLPSSLISSFELGDMIVNEADGWSFICMYKSDEYVYFDGLQNNTTYTIIYYYNKATSSWLYDDDVYHEIVQNVYSYTGYVQGVDTAGDAGSVNVMFQFISFTEIDDSTDIEYVLAALASSSNRMCYAPIQIINSNTEHIATVELVTNSDGTFVVATYTGLSIEFNIRNATHCRVARFDCTKRVTDIIIDK